MGLIPPTLDSPVGGSYDPAGQRRKLRPREGTWPWSHRGRKGRGQRGCRGHSGHCPGLARLLCPGPLPTPPSPVASINTGLVRPRGKEMKEEGAAASELTPPVLGWKNRPSPGVGAPLVLSSSPAPAGLLSPVWSERSPCSLYRPVHTCLGRPSYPPARGFRVSRPGVHPFYPRPATRCLRGN